MRRRFPTIESRKPRSVHTIKDQVRIGFLRPTYYPIPDTAVQQSSRKLEYTNIQVGLIPYDLNDLNTISNRMLAATCRGIIEYLRLRVAH